MLTRPSRRHGLFGAVLLVTLLPLLGLVEIELATPRAAGLRVDPPEGYHVPPAAVLRVASFGFNELAADLLWVRTIIYFADHTRDGDMRFLARHLRNIVALDPHFSQVYRFGAAMLMSQGPRQTNEHVMAAIQLLKQAHALWPEDWRFPLHIGAYYLSELESPSEHVKSRWRLEGADWINRACLGDGVPPWIPSLAANIYTEQGMRDLAILKLKELYLAAQSEEMRQQILAQLQHLANEKDALAVKQAVEALAAAQHANRLGFVPVDLFVLLGLPALEPFSLARIAERGERGVVQ